MKSKVKFGIISVLITFGTVSFSSSDSVFAKTHKTEAVSSIETFTFLSHGKKTNGKIYLPASYPSNKNLPVIYLIDFAEQHFKLATDEFEKVIDAVNQVEGFEALVVSLENIPNFNAEPETFKEHYEIFKNMASYVDTKFTKNTSKTLIGRGSESGIVLMTLFIENEDTSVFNNFIATDPSPNYTSALMDLIEKDRVPKKESNKKLHLSFSTTNDQVQCTKLINLIKDTNYHWLDFESIEYTESDYENAYPMAYANGIKYVFNK